MSLRSFVLFVRSLARSLPHLRACENYFWESRQLYTDGGERRFGKNRRIEEESSFESSLNPCAAVPARCLGLAKRKAAASSSFFCRRPRYGRAGCSRREPGFSRGTIQGNVRKIIGLDRFRRIGISGAVALLGKKNFFK